MLQPAKTRDASLSKTDKSKTMVLNKDRIDDSGSGSGGWKIAIAATVDGEVTYGEPRRTLFLSHRAGK